MSDNLGIDLGAAVTTAAVARPDGLAVLALGTPTVGMPTAVHVATDGSVVVGDEAVARAGADPTGLVDDLKRRIGDPAAFAVNGHAVTAEVLASHLFASVVSRFRAETGQTPDLVVVTHPASWSDERRAALVRSLALIEVDAVAMTEAEAAEALERVGAVPDDPAHAVALGAAALAADTAGLFDAMPEPSGPIPIVTREDLDGGAPTEAVAATPLPTYESLGPASVFDEVDEEPLRPPPPPLTDAGFDDDYPDPGPDSGDVRSNVVFAAVAGVLVVAIVALAAVLALRGGGDDPDVTVAPSSTTSPSPTGVPDATTTTTTTTTASPTTTSTTTSTTSTTTTTTLAPLPRPGVVALDVDGLVLDPGSPSSQTVRFGTLGVTALDQLSGVLGDPDRDTGLNDDPDCDARVRRLEWGDLRVVLLAGDEAIPGPEAFVQWATVGSGSEPRGLVTPEGIGEGASVAQLLATYPDVAFLGTVFSIGAIDEPHIEGIVSSTEPDGEITKLFAGFGCDQLG